MATSILLRNIGGLDDKRFVLSNSQLARTLFIGTTWNKIRIGLRQTMPDSGGNVGSLKWGLGVCSGLTNLFGDATTTNFFGLGPDVYANGVTATRVAGPPPSYSWSHFAVRRVGSTYTAGSGSVGHIFADPATGYRTIFLLDITKGSPNWTANFFRRSVNTTPADISKEVFLQQMEAATPVLTNHAASGNIALAMDEGAGACDSVNLSWNTSSPGIELSEIAVARLS